MKNKIKETWVRFENMDAFSERESELKEILRKIPGECKVIVYLNESSKKAIMHESIDESQVALLENAFGKENVKYQEKEFEAMEPRRIVPDIVQIIPCNHDMYAVFEDDEGEYKKKVLMYALCDDGNVFPLVFDDYLGVSSVEPAAFDAIRFEMEGGEIFLQGGKQE